jgi:DNA mismatch repair protein MutS
LRAGFDAELDRLRSLASDSKGWIAEFERNEQNRTASVPQGALSNGAFGYAIEITKANLRQSPPTTSASRPWSNAERFTTRGLRPRSARSLRADEQALAARPNSSRRCSPTSWRDEASAGHRPRGG